MAIAVLDVTKTGIYRASTGVVNALDPVVSMVTVQLVKAVATTTQRIWFPDRIDVKGVMLIRNGSETNVDGIPYANNNKSIGWTDGTNMFCLHDMIDGEDANGQDANHSHSDITVCRREQVAPWDTVREGYDVVGVGVGYIDIRTTVDTSAGRDQWVTCIAFGGTECTNVDIFSLDDMGADTTPVTVSGLSAEPSIMFFGSADDSATVASFDDVAKSAAVDAKMCLGFAANISGSPQGCMGIHTSHQTLQTEIVDTTTYISNTKCLAGISAGATNYNITAGTFTASSVTLTQSASASNAICGGMAVTFSSDVSISVVDTEFPTASNYAQTDVGLTSLFAMILSMDGPTAYDTATQIDFSCETVTCFTPKNLYCHNFNTHQGTESYGTAAYSAITSTLEVWESDTEAAASAPDLIFETSAYTIDAQGWDFTVGTNPVVAIKGRALAIGL